MKEKMNSYKNSIIGNGIYDIIKKILGLLLGGVFTPTIISIVIDTLNFSILIRYKIPIMIIITLIALICILEFYDWVFKHHPSTPDVKGNYNVLKKEVFFTYGRDRSKYELILHIQSNIKGLNRINGKYTWSGSEEAKLRCETKHCKIILLTRKDSFIEYEVELRKNYNKGKRTECKIVGDLPDSQHKFIPFFSTQITEETKELIINIHIPPKYNIREVICEEIAIVRNSNQNAMEQLLDEDGKYQWIIKNPKLFYKYSVRWDL